MALLLHVGGWDCSDIGPKKLIIDNKPGAVQYYLPTTLAVEGAL